jgi:hypothetical protein
MHFQDVTYRGPVIDDPDLVNDLPIDLAAVLRKTNGIVAFRGGLHLRGACMKPGWHSLRVAWRGPACFSERYPAVLSQDIPFDQDAVVDQFLLRDGAVVRLFTETGEVGPVAASLPSFLEHVRADADGYLSLQPLLQFEVEGGSPKPGQLLNVYPPFCTKESVS